MSRKKRKLKALRAKEQQGQGQVASRRLTQGLIFSGALNIALATSLVYYAGKSGDSSRKVSHGPTSSLVLDLSKELSLQTVLEEYQKLDFETLTQKLKEKECVQDQWTRRDLALSMLAHKFDFDIQRALHGQEVQSCDFSLDRSENEVVKLYSNLSDSHYRQVFSFLKTEEWPYTSEGLFNRIQQGQPSPSLKRALYLSREFMLIEALLAPNGLSSDDVLELISSGPFSIVQSFADSKPLIQNFSGALRVEFLCQYLEHASEMAAQLILKSDPDYALRKLSDDKVVALLGLLENKSELTQNFALHLALGSRAEWVQQEACRMLYHYSGKEFAEPFNYDQALHFIAMEYDLLGATSAPAPVSQTPAVEPVVEEKVELKEPPIQARIYQVQPGDCLSKIARKHDVDVKALKAANELEDDLIKVGMRLVIP